MLANVSQLYEFDDIIDVRSPAEFAEDHVPGAINCPVLDNEERARIGTLYKQVSPFDAKKLGAALVAKNIARHLETTLFDHPKTWQPLVYCWRGGKRSGAMAHILHQVGWKTAQLDGGYKAYRRFVIDSLDTLPLQFDFYVVCGPTGSGKSRLLQLIGEAGAQIIDLERIACHKGSLLGNLPDTPQPGQKMFESWIAVALARFDRSRPVFLEAESKKIGNLRVPEVLLERMWQGKCIRLETSVASRVEMLKEDYLHFIDAPKMLNTKLGFLVDLHGREVIGQWQTLAQQGQWDELVTILLEKHYDPAYRKSTLKHYPNYTSGLPLKAATLDAAALKPLAQQAIGWSLEQQRILPE